MITFLIAAICWYIVEFLSAMEDLLGRSKFIDPIYLWAHRTHVGHYLKLDVKKKRFMLRYILREE